MIPSSLSSGLQVIQQAQRDLTQGAQTVASSPKPGGGVPSLPPAATSESLAMTQAALYGAAGATVVRRSDDVIGALLDIKA